MFVIRLAASVAVVGTLVASHASAAGARPEERLGSAAPRSTAAQPSRAPLARRLAARVARARTPATRYRALLDVMRAVRLGVYTKQGKAIVRGSERGPRDVYLYDFEVRAIASALASRRTWSVDDVATALGRAGLRRRNGPFTGQAVRSVLVAGSRSAIARPRRARALVPLLVRELGRLQQPAYDLRQNIPAERLRLDALQLALAVADATVPAARRTRSAAALREPARANVCGTFQGVPVIPVFGGFAWAGGGGSLVGATGTIVSAAHGFILGLVGVEMRVVEAGGRSHYGPAGHSEQAGQELVFGVFVRSTVAIGGPVPCGFLLGMTLPPGPVRGASIVWDPTILDRLDRYGEVTAQPAGTSPLTGLTGSDGMARLRFRPNDETLPGLGREVTKAGIVHARMRFDTTPTHPLLGQVYNVAAQFPVQFTWEVRYHEQHVFDASLSGRQATSWTLMHRDRWTVPCGVDADGSGSQTMTISTPTPTRVVFYQDAAGAWQLRRADMSLPPLAFPLSAQIDRSGSIDTRSASPDPCAGFRRAAAAAPPTLAPDCGSRSANVQGRLGFDGSALAVTGTYSDPFEECPVIGPAGHELVAARADAPLGLIAQPEVGRIIATGTASAPYDVSQVFTTRVGTTTIEDHATNAIEWALTLDRVPPRPSPR